jgi:hypothetical protein
MGPASSPLNPVPVGALPSMFRWVGFLPEPSTAWRLTLRNPGGMDLSSLPLKSERGYRCAVSWVLSLGAFDNGARPRFRPEV